MQTGRVPARAGRAWAVIAWCTTLAGIAAIALAQRGAPEAPGMDRVQLAAQRQSLSALRNMRVAMYGDVSPRNRTMPVRQAAFWNVPVGAWPHIGKLTTLEDLSLVASDARGQGLSVLRNLRRLRQLTLSNSQATPRVLEHIAPLQHLERLSVDFTVLRQDEPWLREQLGELTAAEQQLVERQAARGSSKERFALVAVLTDRSLRHLNDLNHLKTLKLSNTFITAAGLEHLQDVDSLEELEVSFLEFTPRAAELLSQHESLRRFRYANVSDETLARLATLRNLEELEVWAEDVTDAAVPHLVKLVNLRKLALRGSQLTDQGLQSLARLELEHLQLLDLQYSPALTEEGIAAFREAHPKCEVIFKSAERRSQSPKGRQPSVGRGDPS